MPEQVNPQITDSVTQANVKSIAEQPEMLKNLMNQSLIDATAIAQQNAVNAQQQANVANQTTTPSTAELDAIRAQLDKVVAELNASANLKPMDPNAK